MIFTERKKEKKEGKKYEKREKANNLAIEARKRRDKNSTRNKEIVREHREKETSCKPLHLCAIFKFNGKPSLFPQISYPHSVFVHENVKIEYDFDEV